MLCYQWNRGSTPVEPDKLEIIAGGKITEDVLNKFPVWADGKRRNNRLEKVREKQNEFSERQRLKGIASGIKRRTPVEPRLNPGSTEMATGGQPKTNSPISSLQSPSKEECDGGLALTLPDVFVRMKQSLMAEFERSEGDWDMGDDAALSPVSRRPAALDELTLLLEYRKAKGSYAVQDLKRLLMNWTENLDKARTHKKYANHPTTNGQRVDFNKGTLNEGRADRYSKANRERARSVPDSPGA